MNILVGTGLIAGGAYLGIQGMMKLDPDHGICLGKKEKWFLVLAGTVSSAVWSFTIRENNHFAACIWLLVHIYFVMSSLMDVSTYKVYDIFQYLGAAAAALLVLTANVTPAVGFSLLVFALLQYFVFMHFYGVADGMAFLVAAMIEGSLGYDIAVYLLHMIFAYLFLCIVQALRRNIGRSAKLKKSVAFYPYIMIGFWWIVLWGDKMYRYI